MAIMTTVKVTTETRNHLRDIAAAEGVTAGQLIAQLLDEHVWRKKMDQARRAMRAASQEDWAEYMREFREWDATSSDGLKGYE